MSLEKLTPCATLDAATRARLVEQPPVGGRVNLLGICVTGASGNLVELAVVCDNPKKATKLLE